MVNLISKMKNAQILMKLKNLTEIEKMIKFLLNLAQLVITSKTTLPTKVINDVN